MSQQTQHVHRLLLLIPAARRAAVRNWWTANLDAADGGATWAVALSASGSLPATAYWCSAALTGPQLRLLILQLVQSAGLAVPDTTGWGRADYVTWVATNAAAVQAATGIRVRRSDNDGGWDAPEALLAAAGLRRVAPASP